nr:agmatine deiminase family protein [Legionella quinlivanii]
MFMITPRQAGYYMPAEWYPHAACWMAWPRHLQTWSAIGLERARKAYAKVAKAISQYEPVMMLVQPGEEAQVAEYCNDSVRIIPLPLDDSWTRDTGATFLLNDQYELAGIDWIHNAWGGNYPEYELDQEIAKALIQYTEARYFKAPLVMEGGSFHVDGEGTVLTTRECLLNKNRNPQLGQHQIESYLHEFLGTEQAIWLNRGLIGDETDGHIDEIACFIEPAKVLALTTSDKTDVNYYLLQENLEILKTARDAKGRALEVVTVEQPPATYMNDERLTLSYINFYRANQGIVMPSFGHASYDEAAFVLFKQLFPTCRISQIDALDVFAGGGGIHCITQQQPVSR